MKNYFGAQRRHDDRHLDRLVAQVRAAAELVAFDHPLRQEILEAFAVLYREMEGDARLDGACHALAAHGHIVLSELGVSNELRIGETRRPGDETSGTHSWVDIDGLCFDVATARPLEPDLRRETAAILGTTEIPSGTPTDLAFDVPGDLDLDGQRVLSLSIGEWSDDLTGVGGPDFWFWVERSCRRMGLRGTKGSRLKAKYGRGRWIYRPPGE